MVELFIIVYPDFLPPLGEHRPLVFPLPAQRHAWSDAVLERPSVRKTSAGVEEMARAARRYYVEYVSPGAAGVL